MVFQLFHVFGETLTLQGMVLTPCFLPAFVAAIDHPAFCAFFTLLHVRVCVRMVAVWPVVVLRVDNGRFKPSQAMVAVSWMKLWIGGAWSIRIGSFARKQDKRFLCGD